MRNIAGLLSEQSKAAFASLSPFDQEQAINELQAMGMTTADVSVIGFSDGGQVCRVSPLSLP
jgi:hypothetical protein